MRGQYSSKTESGHRIILQDPRFQHDIETVWQLGPRPFAELLIEAAGDNPHLPALLARYAALDAALVSAVGADRFPASVWEVPK
jgi:hypothetical protein